RADDAGGTYVYPDIREQTGIASRGPFYPPAISISREGEMTLAARMTRFSRRMSSLLGLHDPYRVRTAVLAHVFYHDLWDELAGYISNLPLPYDLYVNLVEGNPDNERLTPYIRARFPTANVQVTENRGRDIGGFLRLIATVLKSGRPYDSLILLHSKKSIRQ